MFAESAIPVQPKSLSDWLRATVWCRNHGISIQTFHRWRLREDGPPSYKLFGTWYVNPAEMEAWIKARSCRPSSSSPASTTPARRHREQLAADDLAREMLHGR